MRLFDWLLGRHQARGTSEAKKENSVERNLRIAKADAKAWWSKQLASRNEARCDRCNKPIPRGEGCLTPSRYVDDIKAGTLEDPDMISRLLGSSPDLVCEPCFRRYAAMGERWAIPWSKASQVTSSPTRTKEALKQKLEERKRKGSESPLSQLSKVEEELKRREK